MDDPRISGYLSREESYRLPPWINENSVIDPTNITLEQEVKRLARPGLGPTAYGKDLRHIRSHSFPANSLEEDKVQVVDYPWRERDLSAARKRIGDQNETN